MILYVSGVKVLTPVLITDAVENIVLGLPWLKMNNVLWNVREQWVEMYQRRIPLHSQPKRDTAIHARGMKLDYGPLPPPSRKRRSATKTETGKTVELPAGWNRAT